MRFEDNRVVPRLSIARFAIFPRPRVPPPPPPSSRFPPSFFLRPPNFSNLKCRSLARVDDIYATRIRRIRLNRLFAKLIFSHFRREEHFYLGENGGRGSRKIFKKKLGVLEWIRLPSNDAFFFNGTRVKREANKFRRE